MSKNLWGGRFTGDIDAQFAWFNASLRFDKRLFAADITGSLAYAEGLRQVGILTDDEAQQIKDGLEAILEEGQADPNYLERGVEAGIEDIHSFVEGELVKKVGDVGLKLHTGRSRNDQVATDIRIYLREEIDQLQQLLDELQRGLIEMAEKYQHVAMPGYTHLQKAMPILFAHFLLAYFEMFARDQERLGDIRSRVNRLPLGSAAMAGTNYPIDRALLAELLDFDEITRNSMDAVSDRDFVIEFLGASSLIMMHLSRLCEDLIIYSTSEFGFIEMSDQVSTGSSIMPQKKNPDALELIRGKMGRVVGHQMALLTTTKGLPLCYNKDMQEDKEPLFDTIDTLALCIPVATTVVTTMKLNEERMNRSASRDYLNATELADYLVRKGLPFRQAHEAVGKAVLFAIQNQKQLEEVSLGTYQDICELFEEDLFEALSLESTLAGKNVVGGTAPQQVADAIQEAKEHLLFTDPV